MRPPPLQPRLPRRVAGLEDQPAARPQGRTGGGQDGAPFLIRDEDLRHVAGHRRQVRLHRGQRVRRPVHPAHPVAERLGPGDVQRRQRGIEPGNREAPRREQAGEGPGAAPDVQHRTCPELRRHRRVYLEIRPVLVQGIVEGREPRLGVMRIDHNG
jgi:hypothetical protein